MDNQRPAPRAAVIFVFVTVVIDMLAMGVVIPVLPRLILSFEGGNQVSAAAIYGYFGIVFSAAQFFFSPVMGALSDRFGRRPVLLISVFGHGLDFILMALAPTLAWLFVGRLISGLTAASIGTANAYIADVTPPERRAQTFGMMGAAFGVGFVIGPAMGGILGEIDMHLPFWAAAGLCLLNAAFGYFVLPESLPPERRTPFRLANANPIGSLAFLKTQGPAVTRLIAISAIFNTAFIVIPTTSVLYAGYRYGWTEGDVGIWLAFIGGCNIVVQMLLTRPAVRLMGEAMTVRVGLSCALLGMVIYGLAPAGWIFLIGTLFQALSGIMGPALQSIVTTSVSPTDQGKLQGSLASVIGVAGMIGPLLFSQIYAWAIVAHWAPLGSAFLVAAGLIAMALLLAWVTALRARREVAV